MQCINQSCTIAIYFNRNVNKSFVSFVKNVCFNPNLSALKVTSLRKCHQQCKFTESIYKKEYQNKVVYVYYRCIKGCAEWKVSGEGSLFEATEPEGRDCDKVTIEKAEEDMEIEQV